MLHEKLHKRLLASEVILIIASVFIFRSLWHLLDIIPFMNETSVLAISVVAGFFLAIPAWRYIINHEH